MSISSKLIDLATCKLAIKTAIEAKQPSVQPSNDLSSWSSAIGSIVQLKGETKTASPSTSQQTIIPSSGKNGITQLTLSPVTSSIDANIVAGNIKSGVSILGVSGSLTPGITPSGNINITTMNQTNVTNYATAQVVDANLVAGNIKKNIQILGVTGSYEGSGGGGGGGLQGYNLTVETNEGSCSFTLYHPDGTSSNVNVSANSSSTFTNVAYFQMYVQLESGYSGWYQRFILLLSDTSIYIDYGCILKGSLVNLWNGRTKKIEDITYNDEILCWDFDNGKYASAKPFWIKKSQTNTFYWINKFESGKEIRTTGTVAGHRFFNINKGKFLYNTECVGDFCYTKDGPDKLIEAKYVEGECEFYNIYTHYHMNLFANRILTGFRYNNLYPIKDMKFIKDNRKFRCRDEFKSIPDSWFYGMRCTEQTDSVEEITSYAMSREIIKK